MKPKKNKFALHRLLKIGLCLIAVWSIHFKPVRAQGNPFHAVDSMLRAFFSPICVPDTGQFLYEMSSHVLKQSYFSDNSTDTLSVNSWHKLYEEMRKMAWDTSIMEPVDSIYKWAHLFQKDTIVMDIMCYNYYTLHDSALVTDSFFNWDTTNFTISDKYPCELFPFVENRVFASCPSENYLPYNAVTYRIDQDFIFHDQWNDFATRGWHIEIDFDDGNGWQSFPITMGGMADHYDAYYSSPGYKYIKTRVLDPMTGMYIMSSIAQVEAPSKPKPPEPALKISFPGIDVAAYFPCEESGEPFKKVIIAVEGYDPSNNFFGNNTAADVYAELIQGPELDDLSNFGYTFVAIDWHDSRQDMILNAKYLEAVIDWLKCQQMTSADTGTHEQFVMVAQSMGGLVARYALCDMEKNWRLLHGCLDEKRHNTRLLITYDSPHEGVNIPLAYQHLYRDIGRAIGAPSIVQAATGAMSNILLDGKAVKQMLLYHVDTRHPITHEYFEHPDRTAFKTALGLLGDYPEYCKLFAMSNGSIKGDGQSDVLTGNQRSPHDYFLNWDTDVFASVLGNTIQILGTNVELRSTPNGSGNLAVFHQDFYRPEIFFSVKIKWRWPWPPKIKVTLKVSSKYWYSAGLTHHANNLEPYDVVPGSPEGAREFVQANGTPTFMVSRLFLGGLSQPTFSGGTWSLTHNGPSIGGVNGIGGFLNASFATNGSHFCFVPVFSSLSYDMGSNYWLDIENENIAVKTSSAKTPMDVITGITETWSFSTVFRHHREHVNIENPLLQVNNNGVWGPFTYDTCQGDPHPGNVRLLNREIGDDSLFLNNRSVAWTCLYDAEKYIGVDILNPYYEHDGYLTNRAITGYYSKNGGYNSTAGITYLYVRSNTNNIQFASWPVAYSVFLDTIDWVKCCNAVGPLMPDDFVSVFDLDEELRISDAENLNVYPNPVTGTELTIEFESQSASDGAVAIYDMMGKKVWENTFNHTKPETKSKFTLSTRNEALPSGTYMVVLLNENTIHKKVFVIP